MRMKITPKIIVYTITMKMRPKQYCMVSWIILGWRFVQKPVYHIIMKVRPKSIVIVL